MHGRQQFSLCLGSSVVTTRGEGYTSAPTVTVPEIKGVRAKAELSFDKDFAKNGGVTAITLVEPKTN